MPDTPERVAKVTAALGDALWGLRATTVRALDDLARELDRLPTGHEAQELRDVLRLWHERIQDAHARSDRAYRDLENLDIDLATMN